MNMIDPTNDSTANGVAYDNMRPNADPTYQTNDQTPNLTLTPEPGQVDIDALTIQAAAQRLGLTTDAIRMRLKRGTLAGRKVEGRWVVLVPRSNVDPTGTEREETPRDPTPERVTQRSTEHQTQCNDEQTNTTRELLDALRSENAYLRSLLDSEVEARRRADHLVAGLMERLPELTAGTSPDRHVPPVDREVVDAASTPDSPEIPWWRRVLDRLGGS